jgi:GDP-4-dehydro-6-deoxy-D-mannose reductase
LKKKLLLIGGSGFVGTHINSILSSEYAVISHGHEFDVRDAKQIRRLIGDEKPDFLVHLAAISTIGESINNPSETYDINFGGVLNVLMALRECEFSGRMLYVSSSEVYGLIAETELPVIEERPLKPLSPYAVSKIAAEALCYQWSQTVNFEIVMARPFNHIGPGQSERFAIADFARQIVAIKLGLADPIMNIGDVDTTRDFTDVRDVVRAYQLLLNQDRCNGEVFNVCSGTERSIRSLIVCMCELAGVEVELRVDPNRVRKSEQRRVRGSSVKLNKYTGWHPEFSIDRTLSDILSFWEAKLLRSR